MAEGFIKTIPGKCLEETARDYLMELVHRNLLSIDQQGSKWNAKSYIMHDLLRDLCVRKAQEEKFFYVGSDAIKDLNPKDMLRLRLSVHLSLDQFTRIMESSDIPYAVRSLLLFPHYGFLKDSWIENVVRMRLLKVLDIMSVDTMVFPKEMERLVNLRYLAANIWSSVIHPISGLCNLQTLILCVRGESFDGKAKELLDMPELRQIKFKGYPPLFHLKNWESVGVAEQLQTLSGVSIDDSFPRIIKAIPNLKKLGIHWRKGTPLLSNIDLRFLGQLQILKCCDLPWGLGSSPDLELILPPSLKKLTLYRCHIPIQFLDEIGRLPNLQVLKLERCYGMWEWKPTEGQFQQLRFLLLFWCGISRWIADETHYYPRLEHLIIHSCVSLEEIPSAIGDIPTLKIIEVKGTIRASGLKSARRIQEDQIDCYGNDALQVRIETRTPPNLNSKTVVVGINEDMFLLKELLMSQESKLEVIAIVGMGGIGKTTLARTFYDDGFVASYFDKRAWIVISQSFSVREMLSGLLECITGNKMIHQDCSELGLQLYQSLCGRRYLIVLDDIWSYEAWDCIKTFFPDENNGSRILVTTREQNVANDVGGFENYRHQMKLLNEIESWELLRRTVYPEGQCSLELENVGKNIAQKCRGLPLAINVVGGILSLLGKTPEAWLQVAEDVGSFVANEDDEKISNILSLSYNHLPNYLKPCFLYMGAFPEDFKIKTSKLIRLWMAEGFIKTIPGMSPEETAREYLMQLVRRNLLSIDQQGSKWHARSYIMHDLLRDLCIRKAEEKKFLYVGNDAIMDWNPKDMLQLRLSVDPSCDQFTRIMESSDIPYVVRSLLLFSSDQCPELSWFDKVVRLRLLNVLDMMAIIGVVFTKEMERLVNLRYLAANAHISASVTFPISSLCNLQTLILSLDDDSFDGKAKELLDMSELRHIKFKDEGYPLFRLEDWESVGVAEQLQTLSTVSIDDSFPRIIKAIPNLKKLGIHWRKSTPLSSNIDLSFLTQLQILKCKGFFPWGLGRSPELELILPPSLKKLAFYMCDDIPNRFLDEIGRLPNLQVLKLVDCYGMRDWKPTEGQFQQLRFLLLRSFDISRWIADETHYPRLEHLIVEHCYSLEEIPSAIGDIPTLKIIEVKGKMRASALESAREIQMYQIQYGNDALQVRINAFVFWPK